MDGLQLKKVIFNPTEVILLKKKGNITIRTDDIEWIEYEKPNLWNCFWAGVCPDGTFPGYLKIFLSKKINNSKSYLIRIKYDDIRKLPEFYLRKIDPSNKWGLLD